MRFSVFLTFLIYTESNLIITPHRQLSRKNSPQNLQKSPKTHTLKAKLFDKQKSRQNNKIYQIKTRPDGRVIFRFIQSLEIISKPDLEVFCICNIIRIPQHFNIPIFISRHIITIMFKIITSIYTQEIQFCI